MSSGNNTPDRSHHRSGEMYNSTKMTTQRVSVVTEQLESFIKYRSEMQKLGEGNKQQIMTRQGEIIQILTSLISDYENISSSRIESVSGFHIETFRTQLITLQTELRNAQDDLPRTEKMLVAKKDVQEKEYHARASEFERHCQAEQNDLHSKRENIILQARQQDEVDGQRRVTEHQTLEDGKVKITGEREDRLKAIQGSFGQKVQVLEADRNTKWQQLQDIRAKLVHDRSHFDASIQDKIAQCTEQAHKHKDGLLRGHKDWESNIHNDINCHTTHTDGQIHDLKTAHLTHQQQIDARCSQEINVLVQQRSDLEGKIAREREELYKQRMAFEQQKQEMVNSFNLQLTEQRNKLQIEMNSCSSDAHTKLQGELDQLNQRIRDLISQITQFKSELDIEISNREQREYENQMEGQRKIADEESQLQLKFQTYNKQLDDQIEKLNMYQYTERARYQEERSKLLQLKAELEAKMSEWVRVKTVVSETVKDWTQIVDLDVRGDQISLPHELIHRYKGSKMDLYFLKSNESEWVMHQGRIFLERDPRIFRMVIKFIQSQGQLDISSLERSSDWTMFESEMNFWGIDLKLNQRSTSLRSSNYVVASSSPKPEASTIRYTTLRADYQSQPEMNLSQPTQMRSSYVVSSSSPKPEASSIRYTSLRAENQSPHVVQRSEYDNVMQTNQTTPRVSFNLNQSPAPIMRTSTTHVTNNEQALRGGNYTTLQQQVQSVPSNISMQSVPQHQVTTTYQSNNEQALRGGNIRTIQQQVTPQQVKTSTITSSSTASFGGDLETRAIRNVVESLWGNYDQDNNGVLDRQEAMRFIKSTLSALGGQVGSGAGSVNDSSIQGAFDQIDVDHSGSLDKSEMEGVIGKLLNGGQLASI